MAALAALLQPETVAVVGANEDPTSFGGRIWRYLGNSSGVQRMAVNARPTAFREGECARSLAELPAVPDVVVLATPAGSVETLLGDAVKAGARAAIVISRVPSDSRVRIQQLAAEGGLVLLGASSLGVINANRNTVLSSSVSLELSLRGGPLALVAQSGALMGVLHARAMQQGLGIGLCISTGDQLQVRVEHVLAEIAENAEIGGNEELAAVGVYLEDLDAGLFANVARLFERQGRRLIVLKGGLTTRGSTAAAAHSGALASDGRAFRAIARDLGVVVANDVEHLLSCMQASQIKGRRWYVATLSGGLAAVAGDLATSAGLELTASGHGVAAVLHSDDAAAFVNPVDIDAFAPANGEASTAIARLASDPAADGVLVVLNDKPDLEGLLAALGALDASSAGRMHLCSECSAQYEPALQSWVHSGGSFTRGLAAFFSALGSMAAPGTSGQSGSVRARGMAAGGVSPSALQPPSSVELIPAVLAQSMLSEAGIPALALYDISSPLDIERVVDACGTPLVLKVANVDHRSPAGVRIARNRDEALAAFLVLVEAGPVVAQPLAGPGLEFYVGITADPVFGPLFLIGAGGPVLESLDDVSVHIGLPDREGVRRCLRQTGIGKWLYESLGSRLVDLEAVVDIAVLASALARDHSADLVGIDLNPVVVGSSGGTVVDAKIRFMKWASTDTELAS